MNSVKIKLKQETENVTDSKPHKRNREFFHFSLFFFFISVKKYSFSR